jgi:hypothetical protein
LLGTQPRVFQGFLGGRVGIRFAISGRRPERAGSEEDIVTNDRGAIRFGGIDSPAPWWVTSFWLFFFLIGFSSLLANLLHLG